MSCAEVCVECEGAVLGRCEGGGRVSGVLVAALG